MIIEETAGVAAVAGGSNEELPLEMLSERLAFFPNHSFILHFLRSLLCYVAAAFIASSNLNSLVVPEEAATAIVDPLHISFSLFYRDYTPPPSAAFPLGVDSELINLELLLQL